MMRWNDFAVAFSRNKRYMIRDQTYFFMEFLSSNSGKEEEYQPRDLLSCVRTQKVYRQDGRRQSCNNGDSNKGSFEKSLQNEKKADMQNNKILDRITVSDMIMSYTPRYGPMRDRV